MKLIRNLNISDKKWCDLNRSSKYASPFQTRKFCEISNAIPNYSTDIFAVELSEEYQALCVLVTIREPGILSYFSRRGIIYGGPLVRGNNEQAMEFLLNEVYLAKKGELIYLEVRNFFNYSAFRHTYLANGWQYKNYLNYLISLDGEENCFMKIKAEKRRQIRKAYKSGATVEYHKLPDESVISDLYELMQSLYYKKVKKPLPPKAFFCQISKFEQCRTITINYNDKIIGGGFVLFSKEAVYDWFRVGDDLRFKKQYPSTLAAWAAIQMGLNLGCRWFDFMGAGYSGKEYGVREFKSQFGGELVENGRFIKVLNPVLFILGKIGLKLLAISKK